MKLERKKSILSKLNYAHAHKDLDGYTPKSKYQPFVELVAQLCDNVIAGEDMYMTIGMTRDRTGLLVCITWDGEKTYVVAPSLEMLSKECEPLLD